ncbi:hypothetical protein P4O66_013468 [Electrophorus voltai]|uniref:Uncharacterized protein n=1 Tax=Electrophorus voltai TaxID=2609070 RepID=A0AAD8Z2V1_9TELE|nr:hypothetical protein P4O66_013468 [Electrophorus voltai]
MRPFRPCFPGRADYISFIDLRRPSRVRQGAALGVDTNFRLGKQCLFIPLNSAETIKHGRVRELAYPRARPEGNHPHLCHESWMAAETPPRIRKKEKTPPPSSDNNINNNINNNTNKQQQQQHMGHITARSGSGAPQRGSE